MERTPVWVNNIINFDSLVGPDKQQAHKLDLIWSKFPSIFNDLLKINKLLIRTVVIKYTTKGWSIMRAWITNMQAMLLFSSLWAQQETSFSSQAKIN